MLKLKPGLLNWSPVVLTDIAVRALVPLVILFGPMLPITPFALAPIPTIPGPPLTVVAIPPIPTPAAD